MYKKVIAKVSAPEAVWKFAAAPITSSAALPPSVAPRDENVVNEWRQSDDELVKPRHGENTICIHPRLFQAFLTCKKQFYLERHTPQAEMPTLENGVIVRMADGAAFANVVREKHFKNSRIVKTPDFASAVEKTTDFLKLYARTMNATGEDLVLHRPAFAWKPRGEASSVELRVRPAVMRYVLKTKSWSILETSSGSGNNMSSQELCDQTHRLHFSSLVVSNFMSSGIVKELSNVVCVDTSGIYDVNTFGGANPHTLAKFSSLQKISEKSEVRLDDTSAEIVSMMQEIDTPSNLPLFAHRETDTIAKVISSGCKNSVKSACGSHCNREPCKFFAPLFCQPPVVKNAIEVGDNWITTLPSGNASVKFDLWNNGSRLLSSALQKHESGELKLSPTQLRFVCATIAKKIAVHSKMIGDWLDELPYPIFCLDFEASQFAIPPFAHMRPHEHIPFQYSLHVFHHDILTEVPKRYSHIEFAGDAVPGSDPRKRIVQTLMGHIKSERLKNPKKQSPGTKVAREKMNLVYGNTITKDLKKKLQVNDGDGCILAHYTSFEKRMLQGLGNYSTAYKDDIAALIFYDTMDLMRSGVVHPSSGGSQSMKKILPALCPEIKYADFDDGSAAGGDNASALYRLWMFEMGGSRKHAPAAPTVESDAILNEKKKKWDGLRESLLTYCDMDAQGTWELVRAAHALKVKAQALKKVDKDGWTLV